MVSMKKTNKKADVIENELEQMWLQWLALNLNLRILWMKPGDEPNLFDSYKFINFHESFWC